LKANGNALLSSALWYARHGWRVFPLQWVRDHGGALRCSCKDFATCDSPGKHPLTSHGVYEATVDLALLRDWWARCPSANIGLACGAPSGVWALDVDGPDGADTLADLQAQQGALPATVENLTGGGGRHLLFRHDPQRPIGNRVKFLPGLDTRADGGYIILPPSLHISGRRYAWESSGRPEGVAIADAPPWLTDLVATGARPSNGKAKDRTLLPPRISKGERHNWMLSLAGTLRRRDVSEAAILACLRAENQERCCPPLSDDEIERIARSMTKYPPALAGMQVRGFDAARAVRQ
jgi:putative DNA primase/helicase